MDGLTYIGGEGYTVEAQEYEDALGLLLSMQSAWLVAQAFEAFESYLYDVTGYFLHAADEEAKQFPLRNANGTQADQLAVEEWCEEVRKRYRRGRNEKLLSYLCQLSPTLADIQQTNCRGLDLDVWYKVVTEVRHAVTHSYGLIRQDRMDSLTSNEQWLLSRRYRGEKTDEGYRLRITPKEKKQALTIFAEYGYVIFKALSQKKGWDWRVLHGQE